MRAVGAGVNESHINCRDSSFFISPVTSCWRRWEGALLKEEEACLPKGLMDIRRVRTKENGGRVLRGLWALLNSFFYQNSRVPLFES